MEPKQDPHPIVLCNAREVIFVHILKTAGTSVLNAIDQGFKLHLPASEIIRRVGREAFDNSYSFAFVRNPWDKVYSHYRYNVKTNQFNMQTKPISFTDWVAACYGPEKDYYYYHRQIQYTDQITWLEDENGEQVVDFVGRFENLEQDFAHVCNELGIENNLQHLNKTIHEDGESEYRKVYTPETRDLIEKAYARDIEHFNYRF